MGGVMAVAASALVVAATDDVHTEPYDAAVAAQEMLVMTVVAVATLPFVGNHTCWAFVQLLLSLRRMYNSGSSDVIVFG